MAVSIQWLDKDKTLLYGTAEGFISREESLEINLQLREMLASVSHPVCVIFDPRKQVHFSPTYLRTLREVHSTPFPNMRMVVFVGNTMAWELFLIFVRQFAGLPYQVASAPTVEAAIDLVRKSYFQDQMPPSSARWN